MSIWTQVFLVNWIVLLTVAFIDRSLLKDKIEEELTILFGLWSLLSFISIPVWLIYLVVA